MTLYTTPKVLPISYPVLLNASPVHERETLLEMRESLHLFSPVKYDTTINYCYYSTARMQQWCSQRVRQQTVSRSLTKNKVGCFDRGQPKNLDDCARMQLLHQSPAHVFDIF